MWWKAALGGESAVIKSHHNVGGLPDYVDFKEIIEPLRDLFKDEVRQAGVSWAFPSGWFAPAVPGAGACHSHHWRGDAREDQNGAAGGRHLPRRGGRPAGRTALGQYFAALTNMRSVGVMGDERTYDYAVALRAVTTTDFMTAEAAPLPWDVIATVTSRIVNEVPHVNRVLYD